MIASELTASEPTAPAWNWPNVWKRDQVGIGLGTAWTPLEHGTPVVGTEFGRGRLELVATQGYDLFYEATEDAIRAASYLSAGQQGAITIDHANFIGAKLRTVDVRGDGHGQHPNSRPVPYQFEQLAATATGRRELETTLKLDRNHYLVDGRWIAIADAAGGVKILEALKYVDSLEQEAGSGR